VIHESLFISTSVITYHQVCKRLDVKKMKVRYVWKAIGMNRDLDMFG